MKKRIVSALLVVGLVCMMSFSAVAGITDSTKVKLWGNTVQKYVTNPIGEDTTVKQSLAVAENGEIILPEIEIKQAKDFYIADGYNESEASELAVTYVKEINTLYQEAIKNGYTVTESEISTYIAQMKTDFESAENKDEIYSFIDSFESETAYWDFQFEMLKKDLPIQKYIADKEQEFINSRIINSPSAKAKNSPEYAEKILEVQEEWTAEFESLKDTAEANYNYIVK